MFWFSILEYRNSDVKVSYFTSVFVDVLLNFVQFICVATPENTQLLEYLNTHETVKLIVSIHMLSLVWNFSVGERFFHVETSQFF